MQSQPGFISALDESAKTSLKTLKEYGITENDYSSEAEAMDKVHDMRTRYVTTPQYHGGRVIGAILFEATMDRDVQGMPFAKYLWEQKKVVPFLKSDKGLADEKDGVQMMKDNPGLEAFLDKAIAKGIFCTKQRSLIKDANEAGIKALVEQQFEEAKRTCAKGLVPMIEPEVDIKSPNKAKIEEILLPALLEGLRKLSPDQKVMFKLSLPSKSNHYLPLMGYPSTVRVVALSGGYSRADSCKMLAENCGMIASFARAFREGTHVKQTDEEFAKTLDESIEAIFQASRSVPSKSSRSKTVLLATEKPFAAPAVTDIDNTLRKAGYTLKKLEKYTDEQQLLDAMADVDAVIIRSDIASAKVMDAGKNLNLIVRAGAGYDNIDLGAAAEREIITMNTPGANANAVAELAFGMMISNARNHWDGSSGYELMGKSLAVYGFGAVARNLHRIAKGFGMKFAAYDPYLTKEQIEGAGATYCAKVEDLFNSQFVSLHCPATAETKNSINHALLSKMPKNAVLVNTARPEVVHEEELKQLLEERKDFSYVADVPPKNLEALHALPDGAKRVFVTKKKMGAQTAEANSNAGTQAAHQIVGFFQRGEMRGRVKP